VKITAEDKGAIMRVPNRMLFDPGSARLKEGAGQVLQNAVTILKEHNFDLVVRGHTDDTAVESSAYPTNWELSSSRAAAVLRWLHEQGEISPTRLKAVGYADTQPLVPNNSDANQVLNRRMELFFHRPETQSW
jgi:chemotaxis protein MotB